MKCGMQRFKEDEPIFDAEGNLIAEKHRVRSQLLAASVSYRLPAPPRSLSLILFHGNFVGLPLLLRQERIQVLLEALVGWADRLETGKAKA
jgi:hypothetical protein